MVSISRIYNRVLTSNDHKIREIPIMVLMPHSSCNCRCVMCDIWKANAIKKELTAVDLEPHLESIRKLGVRQIALSGGEALLHQNLWALCGMLKKLNIYISLLSTGLLLKKFAKEVTIHIDEVIISLDGSEEVHNQIRNIPNAYDKLKEGIQRLREINPSFKITGRCVLQKMNFKDLPNIINSAHSLGLNQISFLAADVSSTAFNRPDPWSEHQQMAIALNPDEVKEFHDVVKQTIRDYQDDFRNKFIAENPEKIKKIVAYYKAIVGKGTYPKVSCNAPWISTVIESDGRVMPCFFHEPYGHLNEGSLKQILNSKKALDFRKNLNVTQDPTCQKCVCSIKLPLINA